MVLATQITVALIAGFLLGGLQSFIAGLMARSWGGGTGILWGIIIAVPSAIAAVWLGWYAPIVASVISLLVFALTALSIHRDRGQASAH
jgi:hypothetical protein